MQNRDRLYPGAIINAKKFHRELGIFRAFGRLEKMSENPVLVGGSENLLKKRLDI